MAKWLEHFRGKEEPVGPGRFGAYYLHERVNSGGMADIWLATDEENHPWAVRILNPQARADRISRRRFFHGCEVLQALQPHPYIIRYREHGKYKGIPYLVTEYIEGSNLKLLMAHEDPMLEEHIANILIDSAQALQHIHERGYIHLDFKPENLMINRSGEVRLVDFDMAIPRPEKPQKLKSYPGTPVYMAPEMLLRKEIDHRVDIFAFGVTAYELLTFQKPFPGENAEAVLRLQLDPQWQPPPPSQINPAVPRQLDSIILRCLERDPDRRFPIMDLVVKSLQAILYIS